jgi:hypothetical protein
MHLLSLLVPLLGDKMRPVVVKVVAGVADLLRLCAVYTLGFAISCKSTYNTVKYKSNGTCALHSLALDDVLFTAYNAMFLPFRKKMSSPAPSANANSTHMLIPLLLVLTLYHYLTQDSASM